MTHTIRLREEAEHDLEEAASWYEGQRNGLGFEFLNAIEKTFDLISRSPESFPLVYRNIHRALTRKFPFGVFYLITPSTVVVIGILHGSRHPGRWRGRN
jgi:plasmid stabilization system protein ParE